MEVDAAEIADGVHGEGESMAAPSNADHIIQDELKHTRMVNSPRMQSWTDERHARVGEKARGRDVGPLRDDSSPQEGIAPFPFKEHKTVGASSVV
ncbi:hypothetical protein Ae201684P_001463 [Aphanomyces euteiches]|nr:hypothetical protein Ae201684P_001463 [Aphanomyces euteiches]